MSQLIVADSSVLFHFSIKLEDGSVADSTALHGKACPSADGRRQPDAELRAMPAGAARRGEQELYPGAGRGVRPFQSLTTSTISIAPNSVTKLSPKVGTIILFDQPNGSELPGIIRAVEGMSVTVDFNHPWPVTSSPSRWRSWELMTRRRFTDGYSAC